MARVIVKFPGGEEKTGDVLNFNMNNPTFFLQIENKEGNRETQAVRLNSVKMIHFLKKRRARPVKAGDRGDRTDDLCAHFSFQNHPGIRG